MLPGVSDGVQEGVAKPDDIGLILEHTHDGKEAAFLGSASFHWRPFRRYERQRAG